MSSGDKNDKLREKAEKILDNQLIQTKEQSIGTMNSYMIYVFIKLN